MHLQAFEEDYNTIYASDQDSVSNGLDIFLRPLQQGQLFTRSF